MERKKLRDGAWIDFDGQWIDTERASALHRQLVEEVAWEQRPIVAFGKEIMQPRLLGWAGDVPYAYSGQTLPVRAFTPTLTQLLEEARQACQVPFNHVLLNRYRDGSDHMSYHSDNEPQLGRNPVIAALSLGITRAFVLAPKSARKQKRTYRLQHGSLLVMGGSIQHTWRHAVPKDPNATGERINLTFRWLKGPPGWVHFSEGQVNAPVC